MRFLIFMFSRMKLLALGAAISQISALMATASTMLVGRDVTSKHSDPADLPPGSITTNKETVQTPPLTAPPVA